MNSAPPIAQTTLMNTQFYIVANKVPRYLNMAKLLMFSIRQNAGGLSKAKINLICFGDEYDASDVKELRDAFQPIEIRYYPQKAEPLSNKLYIFRDADPELDAMIYLDTDTVVLGPLDDLARDFYGSNCSFAGLPTAEWGSINRRTFNVNARRVFGNHRARVTKDHRFMYGCPTFNCGVMLVRGYALGHFACVDSVWDDLWAIAHTEKNIYRLWRKVMSLRVLREVYGSFDPGNSEQLAIAMCVFRGAIDYQVLDRTYNCCVPDKAEKPRIFHYMQGLYHFDRERLFQIDFKSSDLHALRALGELADRYNSQIREVTG